MRRAIAARMPEFWCRCWGEKAGQPAYLATPLCFSSGKPQIKVDANSASSYYTNFIRPHPTIRSSNPFDNKQARSLYSKRLLHAMCSCSAPTSLKRS